MGQKILNPFEVLDSRLTEIQSMLIELVHKKNEEIRLRVIEIHSLVLEIKHKPLSPPVIQPPSERFIDTKEVAELLGVSSVSVWDYERKGFLQSYRIGNLKRFKLSEVLASPIPIKRSNKTPRSLKV